MIRNDYKIVVNNDNISDRFKKNNYFNDNYDDLIK